MEERIKWNQGERITVLGADAEIGSNFIKQLTNKNNITIVNKWDIPKLLEKNNICRGELFYNEDTGEMYMVDRGDLELYWLKIGAAQLDEHFRKELQKLNKEDEMKIVDKISEVGNINPFLV